MSWHDVIHETLLHEGISATEQQVENIAESCLIHERESASLRSESRGSPAAYQESQKLRQTKEYHADEMKRLERRHADEIYNLKAEIRYLERKLRETQER